MKNIAIYGRVGSSASKASILDLAEALDAAHFNVSINEELGNYHDLSAIRTWKYQLPEQTELLITLGGDGTILDTVPFTAHRGIPVLGVNLGRLGFLSAGMETNSKELAKQLIEGDFRIEKRSLLSLTTENQLFGNENIALNDCTILKKDRASMIAVSAYVDGELLCSYWADGLIISTPTGSTGYSMSCGGPIAFPQSKVFMLTAIAAHQLNVRPVILSDESKITLEFDQKGVQFAANLDSRTEFFDSGMKLQLEKAPYSFSLIKLNSESFAGTIRKKLLWGIDKRNH